MIIITRTKITKEYITKELTYHFFKRRLPFDPNITKKEVMKIIRDQVYWCGRSGWNGQDIQITEALGDGGEAIELYLEMEIVVSEWVTKKFPNL